MDPTFQGKTNKKLNTRESYRKYNFNLTKVTKATNLPLTSTEPTLCLLTNLPLTATEPTLCLPNEPTLCLPTNPPLTPTEPTLCLQQARWAPQTESPARSKPPDVACCVSTPHVQSLPLQLMMVMLMMTMEKPMDWRWPVARLAQWQRCWGRGWTDTQGWLCTAWSVSQSPPGSLLPLLVCARVQPAACSLQSEWVN